MRDAEREVDRDVEKVRAHLIRYHFLDKIFTKVFDVFCVKVQWFPTFWGFELPCIIFKFVIPLKGKNPYRSFFLVITLQLLPIVS